MKRYVFDLNLTHDQVESYYKGSVGWVQATSIDGLSLRFRLSHLTPYVSHLGVQGRFVIVCDDSGEFVSLQRL